MSGRNDDASGAGLGLAVVGLIVVYVAIVLFVIAAFVALVLSIVALLAAEDGLTLGKWEIDENEARRFLGFGLLGAAVVPVFVLFASFLIGFDTQDSWWFYLVIGGYCAGCLGLFPAVEAEIRKAEAEAAAKRAQVLPPVRSRHAPPPRPFEFADWNDGEDA